MTRITAKRWSPAPGTLDERIVTGERRRHKYGAKPTAVDGIRFASMKEAKRYGELKLLEKAGEIHELHLQPAFDLWTSAGKAWTQKPVGQYRADFAYCECRAAVHNGCCDDGKQVVEDVKGFKTPLYKWKKKHVEAQYGIEIREV